MHMIVSQAQYLRLWMNIDFYPLTDTSGKLEDIIYHIKEPIRPDQIESLMNDTQKLYNGFTHTLHLPKLDL